MTTKEQWLPTDDVQAIDGIGYLRKWVTAGGDAKWLLHRFDLVKQSSVYAWIMKAQALSFVVWLILWSLFTERMGMAAAWTAVILVVTSWTNWILFVGALYNERKGL